MSNSISNTLERVVNILTWKTPPLFSIAESEARFHGFLIILRQRQPYRKKIKYCVECKSRKKNCFKKINILRSETCGRASGDDNKSQVRTYRSVRQYYSVDISKLYNIITRRDWAAAAAI